MANSSESPNTSIPIAHDLRKDLERRENKCILATCGIWRDFPSLGGKFVGTGSLVQGLFINFEEKIHLVTSNKVISSKDLSCYSLYFKKSRDREKEAKKLVKMVSEKMIFKSGLAIVPIDPEKLGIIRKYTSGLLKHRPFTIPTEVKKDLRNDKLYCHVVEESGKSFAISPYQVKGIADEETYVTDLNSIVIESASLCSSYRKGLGAPITIAVKDEAFAVGAITLGNNEQLSFVLFSQIDRTRAISDDELNIYVDVDGLKSGEQNVQTDMVATGSARRQEVQQPGVSAKSAKPKGVSHPQTEDVRIRQQHIFLSIIEDFLQSTKRNSIKDFQFLREYAKEMKLIITDCSLGCLVIKVKCESLMILEELWRDYLSGHLGKVVQNCFVTEMILKELNPAELRLKTIMDVEEYNACKMFFEKDAHRDALSSELYSTSSISESPQKREQWEKSEQKTKIMETAKLEGTSPLTVVPTTDHGKELEEPWGRKGASSSEFHTISSTSESPQKQEELKKWKQKTKIVERKKMKDMSPLTVIPITGHGKELIGKAHGRKGMLPLLGSSTSDPEEELEELRMKLQIVKGASSSEFHSISSTSESPQKQEELKKWKQKTKIVETEKLKGSSSPPLLSTTDLEEKLGSICVNLKMLRVQGSFPVLQFSTIDLEKQLAELIMELQRLRMKGILLPPELFIADLKDDLERLREKLNRLKMTGSSHPLVSTIEVELGELLKQLRKWRKEGRFPVLKFSTICLEETLAALCRLLQRLRMEGTLPFPELLTAALEEKLKELLKELERQRDKGSLPPTFSTIEVEVDELLKKFQKRRMEGALSPEFHSSSSTSESPQKKEEWEKSEQQTKIMETAKLEGTSPLIVIPTTGHGKELEEPWGRKGMLPLPGSSTFDLEEELEELHKKLQITEGGLSSEFHSTSSTSERLQKKEQWEKSEQKTKIMETEKLEGTSPLIVIPTTGHGKELEEPWGRKGMLPLPGSSTFDPEEELEKLYWKLQIMEGSLHSLRTTSLKKKLKQVFEEIMTLRMEGSFSILKLSTTDLKKKLAELSMKLQRLRMEGTLPPPELFTADLEDELEQLRRLIWILEDRKREKGSSHSLFPTIRTVFRLRKELEKVKVEALENAMYPIIRSGLAKFDVSLLGELQNYVSYLLNESAKLHFRKQVLQPLRALEELREAMDKDELIVFLTIHIREGAWQVVLLFTDELPRVKLKLPRDWCGIIHNEDEDEDEEVSDKVIYSSTSGILNGWPSNHSMEYDPDLITLCKAITNRDWKVTRLILSRSRISDEGLKNLSTALPQSELYSLTLNGIGLQSQGLKYLCEALISSDCHLTTLNVSENSWGDEGIVYLCNALTSIDCTLTSLNVSDNTLGDEGIMHLCNALTSVNCRLTSLNASHIQWGDIGIKHLCDALTSSNCVLTKLKISHIRLGDGGIKELSEVLTNRFCKLTSLNIRGNKFGDEGIKHLCKALTDTNCKLQRLNLRANWNVTDEGEKYLSQMLTGTYRKVGGAQLFRTLLERRISLF